MTRKNSLKRHPEKTSAAGDPHWIFLTPDQAVDAVALDFQTYGPQPDLFRRIAPLVLGAQCRVTAPDEKWSGVWVLRGNTFAPVEDDQLGFYLIHVLETDPPDLNTLADICRQVFQTHIVAGYDRAGSISGIWIHSQMDRFICHQCGQCCHTLDYETGCEESDIRQWRETGRTDILAWVQCRNTGPDALGPAYRIWVNPDTGKPARTCPWLTPCPDHAGRFVCTIHDIKPEVCRQYPYTAKHAVMTGCSGHFVPRTETPVSKKF
ncbi:MAG: YkgJ family cysteine cluster protein [Desulfotignum sp.]